MAEKMVPVEADWHGFSCPSCHALFRASREASGRGVECPSCGGRVRIPDLEPAGPPALAAPPVSSPPAPSTPEGETKSLEPAQPTHAAARGAEARESAPEGEVPEVAPRKEMQEEVSPDERVEIPPAGRTRRVRRKVKKKPIEKPEAIDWEADEPSTRSTGTSGLRMSVLGGLATLILMLGIVALVILGHKKPQGDQPPEAPVTPPAFAEPQPSSEVKPAAEDLPEELLKMKEAVENFLEARSVDEMLDFVRRRDVLEERIRRYYQTHDFAPIVARKISPSTRIMKNGDLWAIDVILQDFTPRPIAMEKVAGGYLVDWESWVGYSELPWAEFRAGRPADAMLFRVMVAPVAYYNYAFNDEEKWRSYRLLSPGRDDVLYGYVPRHSILESMLTPSGSEVDRPRAHVVRIRYPDNPVSDSQVLIEEVIASGWVVGEGAVRP